MIMTKHCAEPQRDIMTDGNPLQYHSDVARTDTMYIAQLSTVQ